MTIISLDLESSSECNLRKDGALLYSLHPSTVILLFYWHIVGSSTPPQRWLRGEPFPPELAALIWSGARISGWNVIRFDRAVWANVGVPKQGFPPIPDDSWLDSMYSAAAANLPRNMAGACKALGVPYQDDLKDNREIERITNQNKTPLPLTPADEKWLSDRCRQDVLMEEQALVKMPAWPVTSPWVRMPEIDRRINDRGVLMDVPLVQGLARAADLETDRLDSEMNALTKGQVPRTSTVERLKIWLVENGVALPRKEQPPADEDEQQDADLAGDSEAENEQDQIVYRLRKSDIADILARKDLPEHCRQALLWRQEAAKASAKKLKAMLKSASADGRLRGAFVLLGAQQTWRWSGAVWQPHNFVRDIIANPDEVAEQSGLDVKKHKAIVHRESLLCLDTAIKAGRSGDPRRIESLFGMHRRDLQGRPYYDGVLPFVSRMLRRTLSARRGHLFLNGDYANIEARIPVWLARQMDMLEAFRRSEDVYRKTAAPIYKQTPESLTKEQRQIGKVVRLFCGFAGGANAFIPAAMNYGLTIDREQGTSIVRAFRENSKELVDYWDALLECAVKAVMYPGWEFPVPPMGNITWRLIGNCLHCKLPSDRYIRYWAPRLEQGHWPDGRPKNKPDLTVLQVKGKAVLRRTLWRGLAIENCVQAIAADLLAVALDNMDRHGELPVVLHCHDNAVPEVPEDHADRLLPIFKYAMLDAPAWIGDLPLDAAVGAESRFS